jgi:hypothetical protein
MSVKNWFWNWFGIVNDKPEPAKREVVFPVSEHPYHRQAGTKVTGNGGTTGESGGGGGLGVAYKSVKQDSLADGKPFVLVDNTKPEETKLDTSKETLDKLGIPNTPLKQVDLTETKEAKKVEEQKAETQAETKTESKPLFDNALEEPDKVAHIHQRTTAAAVVKKEKGPTIQPKKAAPAPKEEEPSIGNSGYLNNHSRIESELNKLKIYAETKPIRLILTKQRGGFVHLRFHTKKLKWMVVSADNPHKKWKELDLNLLKTAISARK